MRAIILAFLLFCPIFACAFSGLVLNVHDGDTITVSNELKAFEKVRIYAIDAPEMKSSKWDYQPYAGEARTSLLNLCLNKLAIITRKSKDQYGRTVGTVNCQGFDVAQWQIDTGSAWAYKYTASKALKLRQIKAKEKGVGLWALPASIEPIQWRKGIVQ